MIFCDTGEILPRNNCDLATDISKQLIIRKFIVSCKANLAFMN